MSYRLGVDVGGTFTDMLLVNDDSGDTFRTKTASTPHDQSVGVLRGIEQGVRRRRHRARPRSARCCTAPRSATNAILEGKGAVVGLVTTEGFRQVLQIARSFVPGGLAGWIIWPKPEPLAALENTVEVPERIASRRHVVTPLDEDDVRAQLRKLRGQGIQALAVSSDQRLRQRRARAAHRARSPPRNCPASRSRCPRRCCRRCASTSARSPRWPTATCNLRSPATSRNLASQLAERGVSGKLSILRSDGGWPSAAAAATRPGDDDDVRAGRRRHRRDLGGRTGRLPRLPHFRHGRHVHRCRPGAGSQPRIGRETTVGDLAVRAASVDVRTVGAGGGSIAHVPPLTQALRVGPQSAGADPGPAAYAAGGTDPTVTDANVVLGYLPTELAGGEITLDRQAARAAVQKIVDAISLDSVEAAAAGHRRHRQREHVRRAAPGLGAAGLRSARLRTCRVRRRRPVARQRARAADGNLAGDHPAVARRARAPTATPPPASATNPCAPGPQFQRPHRREPARDPPGTGRSRLRAADRAGHRRVRHEIVYSADLRYLGQGFEIPVDIDLGRLRRNGGGLDALGAVFDAEHQRLFSFLFNAEHEMVTVRATRADRGRKSPPTLCRRRRRSVEGTQVSTEIWVDGAFVQANVYDRGLLAAGNVVRGPAIVTEMDSTTLVLPGPRGHRARQRQFAHPTQFRREDPGGIRPWHV